VSVLWPCCF